MITVELVRDGEFVATKWYYPSAASGGIPCLYEGYLNGKYYSICVMRL